METTFVRVFFIKRHEITHRQITLTCNRFLLLFLFSIQRRRRMIRDKALPYRLSW